MRRPLQVLPLALALALGACKSPPPSETTIPAADRQELERISAEAQKKADAYSRAREAGLRAALQAIKPRPDGPPCAEKIPLPPQLADDDSKLSEGDRAAREAARWRMNVVPEWGVVGGAPPEPLKMIPKIAAEKAARGPRRDQFDRQRGMLGRLIEGGKYSSDWSREAMLKLANEIGSDEYWGWELDVVATMRVDPTHDASSFKSGIIAGKAFLWRFPEGKVVCAANVVATNQDRITLELDPNDKSERKNQRLNDDLETEAFRNAVGALKALE